MYRAIALGSALSQAVWLEKDENYSMAGGLGFSNGVQVAFGVIGIMRFNTHWAGSGGVAIGSGGAWGGKVGLRVGW